jgi:hypothetical protein
MSCGVDPPQEVFLHNVATAKSEIPCRVNKLPGVGVIRRRDPLITAKPTPAASIKDEATDGRRCRGKPSASYGGMAP